MAASSAAAGRAGWSRTGSTWSVFDPHPDAERRVREVLENAEWAWAQLTYAPRVRGTVTFAAELDEAVRDADLVQESVPENVELKRLLFAEIEAHAPADAVIASSTSGLLPSVLQADLRRPERFLVAHPFNPVYLLPLVEIVGGERTSEESVSRAIAFYESVGMRPLRVRSEIDGFVADRLLEALWREALWLVEDEVATVEEIDDAIRFGPGLRWAQMGTFLTYRIAGGEEGMQHFLEQFGPALQWPWTKLMDVPELDAELIDRIATQSDEQAERALGTRARAPSRRQPRGDPAGAPRPGDMQRALSSTHMRRACSELWRPESRPIRAGRSSSSRESSIRRGSTTTAT